MTNHTEILSTAARTLKDRHTQYGPAELCFDRISQIATLILNKEISPYDVTMIMVALKLGRLQESRGLDDNYIDGINYMAFAAQFAKAKTSIETAVEDDIVAMAKRLSPKKSETTNEEDPVDASVVRASLITPWSPTGQ
jgi:midasin (ATPase involved in ribosome maturation)